MKTRIGIALGAALFFASVAVGSAQYDYGNGNIPPGSYQQSCVNISVRGSSISAACTNNNGQRVYSSVDMRQCYGGDIANINGYLSCGGNGYGYGGGYGRDNDDRNDGWSEQLPPGSYQQSCTNVRMTGSILRATCTNNQGYGMRSSLDVNDCGRRSDIGNINGQLRCVWNRYR